MASLYLPSENATAPPAPWYAESITLSSELCDNCASFAKLELTIFLLRAFSAISTRARRICRLLPDRGLHGVLAFMQRGIRFLQKRKPMLRILLIHCHLPVRVGFHLAHVF